MFRRSRLDQRAFQRAVDILREAQRVVALTGAGVSTPSGIPDFRSVGSGLWNFANPMEVASLWGFRARPERFYEWIRPLTKTVLQAKPNPAHFALAELERLGKLRALITQNIDALHQKAGVNEVIELHGHLRTVSCLACGHREPSATYLDAFVSRGEMPRCPSCAAVMKPDVILFGEPLPEAEILRAQEEALHCDLMIVAGSSLEVMPAADLPALAVRSGSKLILVNLGMTPYDHLADARLQGDVADMLPRLVRAI
ncbi:MAG: NAD-dependent protein deacylase [Chloroflexi bacterium]|nr:NAD-dependent protein deacylase [Chloroflexota bacterium]